MSTRKIGFVGLGNMGFGMALRLVGAGHDVLGFDTSAERRAAFEAAGGRATDKLVGLGDGRDVIVTMLPDGKIVQAVLFGDDGIAAHLAPGTVVIDMSSAAPTGSVESGRRLAERGVLLVDAPVSGGMKGAEAGTLSIMAGSDEAETFDSVAQVLAPMGKAERLGRLGAGHAAKAINNYIGAVVIAATAEGLVLGQKFGIEPETLLPVINRSSGRSGVSENLFPAHVLSRTFDYGFAMALMAKDVGLAAGMNEAIGSPLPFVALTAREWAAARDALPGADFSAMQLYIEKLADA